MTESLNITRIHIITVLTLDRYVLNSTHTQHVMPVI